MKYSHRENSDTNNFGPFPGGLPTFWQSSMRMLHGYFKSRTAQYFTPVNSSPCPLPFNICKSDVKIGDYADSLLKEWNVHDLS